MRTGAICTRSSYGEYRSSKWVKAGRIFLQDLRLGRIPDIFALDQHARREALAVAVRHVGAENNLVFADEFQDLRQQRVFNLGAEVQISPPDILHRRQRLFRSGLGNDMGEVFARVLETMLEPVEHEVDRQAARL